MSTALSLGLDPITILAKDLRAGAPTLSLDEARFLVDHYYAIQDNRKTAKNQERALTKSEEPHAIISWLAKNNEVLENNIKSALDRWTDAQPIGRWGKSIVGVGPVLTAGLMAHIAPETKYVGQIWRFAGLDPGLKWEKGKKRPWNAGLKTLCWKLGECLIKTCNNEDSFYGPLYTKRKAYETVRNERGDFAERAAEILKAKNFKKSTEAYKAYITGKFPLAHIHAMARRWTVKLFLSHWHEAAYFLHYGERAEVPYAIDRLGHQHYIPPPNWELIQPSAITSE